MMRLDGRWDVDVGGTVATVLRRMKARASAATSSIVLGTSSSTRSSGVR
jgi:hypothetical protein